MFFLATGPVMKSMAFPCGNSWHLVATKEEKKTVTCMGKEVPGMNELEYVEELSKSTFATALLGEMLHRYHSS